MKVARLLTLAVIAAVGVSFAVKAASAQTAGVSGPGPSDITPTEEPSSWGWIKKPSISMPKISFPKMPADPLAPLKSSARKVSDGTKRAWEGTKELFTFGGSKNEQPQARVASAAEPPSMWQRMFGADQPKNEGPATVGEWMSQPRVE
jgi:hypothetical protein